MSPHYLTELSKWCLPIRNQKEAREKKEKKRDKYKKGERKERKWKPEMPIANWFNLQ